MLNVKRLNACRRFNLIALLLHFYFFVVALLFSSAGAGQSFDNTPVGDTASSPNTISADSNHSTPSLANNSRTAQQLLMGKEAAAIGLGDDQFLTVDEAYPLAVNIEGDQVVATWTIADGYFLYGEQFRFSLQQGDRWISLAASDPIGIVEYDEIFARDVEKHYHHVRIILAKSQFEHSQPAILQVTSQGCADAGLCYPPQVISFTVDIGQNLVTPLQAPTESPMAVGATKINGSGDAVAAKDSPLLGLMILLAFIGGIILNFMPCVFPILSIKALSIANAAGGNRHRLHGWSYTLGIIGAFTLFATLLLIARHNGQAFGWGFQLQSPGFVTALIYLFWVMGLSLSGHMTIGAQFMGVGQKLTQGNGLYHSFFTGVLAVVVASPCTAPFMATALGYALTQPAAVALAVFIALGFGMAFPLLLLCYLPQLEKRLPKPGQWMESLKQALAFPLYLTALWLLWVLGRQLGSDAVSLVLLGAIIIAFAHWMQRHQYLLSRTIAVAAVASIMFIAWENNQRAGEDIQVSATTSTDDNNWLVYSETLLANLRKQGSPVFINVTADWCITCLANEHLVFTEETLSLMRANKIHLIKGDWTNYNPAITQLLNRYDRSGIPLYLLFPPGTNTEAQVLPQILTPTLFRNTIDRIYGDSLEQQNWTPKTG